MDLSFRIRMQPTSTVPARLFFEVLFEDEGCFHALVVGTWNVALVVGRWMKKGHFLNEGKTIENIGKPGLSNEHGYLTDISLKHWSTWPRDGAVDLPNQKDQKARLAGGSRWFKHLTMTIN